MSDAGFGRAVRLDNSAWSRILIRGVPTSVQRRWEAALRRDYDHDLDVISEHTPLEFASVWLAPRGALD